MKIFTIIATDEFNRRYGYTHICFNREFEFDPSWVYQYWMRRMVSDILGRMGTDAKARWICEYEEKEERWLQMEHESSV